MNVRFGRMIFVRSAGRGRNLNCVLRSAGLLTKVGHRSCGHCGHAGTEKVVELSMIGELMIAQIVIDQMLMIGQMIGQIVIDQVRLTERMTAKIVRTQLMMSHLLNLLLIQVHFRFKLSVGQSLRCSTGQIVKFDRRLQVGENVSGRGLFRVTNNKSNMYESKD